MTHDEMIKVIQAEKEGRTIQHEASKGVWRDVHVKVKAFDFQRNKYRVKPERKVVPWTADDWREFLGRCIKIPQKSTQRIIVRLSEFGVDARDSAGATHYIPYEKLLKSWTKMNGNPCGKVVEE